MYLTGSLFFSSSWENGKDNFQQLIIKVCLERMRNFSRIRILLRNIRDFSITGFTEKRKRRSQIQYENSYKTAVFISKIIEGDGIRIVDLSDTNFIKGTCEVIEDTETFSQTAKDMSRFFGCILKRGQPTSSDILMKLGSVEKEWEIL